MDSNLSPRNRELLIVAALLALGLLTRFFGIDHQSIWIDEGSTFYFSHYTWDQFATADEPNPPIYYMMEGLFLDLLGQTEFGIRFASAVAGALTVPMAYVLSMKLFDSRPAALMTSTLFLLSPICLFYGQEARGYMMVLLIFMIQLYVLIHALESKRNIHWLIFALLSVLQFGMHYSGIVATFTLYLYALYFSCREGLSKDGYRIPIQMLWSGSLYLLLSFPMLMLAYDAGITSRGNGWSWCLVGMDYLINLLNDFLFDVGLSIVLFILTAIGLYLCFRRQRQQAVLLMIVILFPVLLTTLLSFKTNMTPRYVLFAVAGFYLAIPYSLTAVRPEVMNTRRTIAVLAAVSMIVAAIVLPIYYTEITKEDFRTGAEVLSDNVGQGDLVLYATGSENPIYASISFYYDPMGEGIETKGVSSNEELWAYTDTFSYDNIYILILADYDPVDYLLNVDSDNCERICEAYRINVFKITGPLPH